MLEIDNFMIRFIYIFKIRRDGIAEIAKVQRISAIPSEIFGMNDESPFLFARRETQNSNS